MEQQEIKTLKLFEALYENGAQSQRDLSKKLDISLGLVNALLKKVVKDGFFRIVPIGGSRHKYAMTPKGLSEKTMLSYRYLLHSVEYYKSTRNKLGLLFDELNDLKMEKLLFFGVSDFAEIAYITAKEKKIDVLGIIEIDYPGSKFLDIPIFEMSVIRNRHFDAIVITDLKGATEIRDSLTRFGVEKEKIFTLQ